MRVARVARGVDCGEKCGDGGRRGRRGWWRDAQVAGVGAGGGIQQESGAGGDSRREEGVGGRRGWQPPPGGSGREMQVVVAGVMEPYGGEELGGMRV